MHEWHQLPYIFMKPALLSSSRFFLFYSDIFHHFRPLSIYICSMCKHLFLHKVQLVLISYLVYFLFPILVYLVYFIYFAYFYSSIYSFKRCFRIIICLAPVYFSLTSLVFTALSSRHLIFTSV